MPRPPIGGHLFDALAAPGVSMIHQLIGAGARGNTPQQVWETQPCWLLPYQIPASWNCFVAVPAQSRLAAGDAGLG